jgi:hypothetical protein
VMKYRDLLREMQSLSEEQLDQDVRLIGPEIGRRIDSLWILEEDYVDEGYGEGIEPKSVYDDPMYTDDPNFSFDEFTTVAKGTVFLYTEEEK